MANPISPAHYQRGDIEPIDFIRSQGLNFNLGNAVKYIARAGYKDGESINADLTKAIFYLTHELNTIEKQKLRNGSGTGVSESIQRDRFSKPRYEDYAERLDC